jgi:hypothetical protein
MRKRVRLQYRNSPLLLMAPGSRLAIPSNLVLVGTVLVADPLNALVSRFKGARGLGDVRSLGHNAALGT